MNDVERQKIISLLKGKEYLISDYLFLRGYDDVNKILKMKEWNDSKFQGLLTSTIWINNSESIIEKIHLPIWNNTKYEPLLTPTIFTIKSSNILENIKIFEEYGIEDYITTNSIRKNPIELRELLEYLVQNNINLVVDNKLNKMINATKKELKEKYGININNIMGIKIR